MADVPVSAATAASTSIAISRGRSGFGFTVLVPVLARPSWAGTAAGSGLHDALQEERPPGSRPDAEPLRNFPANEEMLSLLPCNVAAS